MTNNLNNLCSQCSCACPWKHIDVNKLYSYIDEELEKDPYWKPHRDRYISSVNYILEHLHDTYHVKGNTLNVLNLGGAYGIIPLTLSLIPGVKLFLYDGQFDVRYTWPDNIDFKSIDLFIATEMLEHLRDLEDSPRCTFTSSGILGMLSECYKNMNDNALLFITTPNGCSFIQIYNLLIGRSPFMYDLHVREMSFEELSMYISKSNFNITHFKTINNFDFDKNKLNLVLKILKTNNFDISNRYDNIYLLCKKK